MDTIINNSFIPLNKNKFLVELKRLGIPKVTIENINWKNCIEEGYCIYNDKKDPKTCFTKIKNKSNNLCSIHKKKKLDEDINEIDNMLKNMDIDVDTDKLNILEYNNKMDYLDNISETICNTEISNNSEKNINNSCLHLSEEGINKLYNELKILLEEISNYKFKKSNNDINILYKSISNYNNNIYESEEEPHICISFLLQFFEELYEISNEFLDRIINSYDNFNIFIELCKKWKTKIKEITNELIIIPNYYQEYYVIINKKINDDLFKILK